ncbi:MAG TPA: hypothetical protein VKU39_05235, partial [Streptosporangiaceae bacterium]|nr:hypothetical protein [Streptosporangiaceae bacterium]
MGFGTPYKVGANTPGSATTQTFNVTHATTAGDAILVALGSTSSSGATVSSVADSQGNSYSRIGTAVTTHQFGDVWIALNTTALTTSDTITVT